jgi:membrane-associated protease RseP (regulator of RpoE activity)
MTSPTLVSEPASPSQAAEDARQFAPSSPAKAARPRLLLPISLFLVTLLSTTAVGMRYMYNFSLGQPPLASDADILPFGWVFTHFSFIASGLPFSLTLIAILLAHEFGHYFACKSFGVRATLPYLLPAPSLSGSFGAVIRLKSRVRSRAALIVIGAMGPIAGFAVALVTIAIGLTLSRYAPQPVLHRVQSPLIITALHALLGNLHGPAHSIFLLIPHPILTASWMGILITALNLIPAGQLDGGHILYAVSPTAHRICHRIVVVGLLLLGIFYWSGWILWSIILMMPGMRHPQVPETGDTKPWHFALIPICLLIFIVAGTFQPFEGFSLIDIARKLPHRY